MSKLIKAGKCTCGRVEQAVRQTTDGRVFTIISGLGYVELERTADFMLKIWDEYFEETEEFAGEMPVEYAIEKSWSHFNHTDDPMPEDIFNKTVKNIMNIFEQAEKECNTYGFLLEAIASK